MNIQVHPGYNRVDFFTEKERSWKWNPPFLGDIMSGKRFHHLNSAMCLLINTPHRHMDCFFWVREMIQAFNTKIIEVFVSPWITCIDKSMVALSNEYAPGWMVVKRKPHPVGNKYHTINDCYCKVNFALRL